MSSHELISLHVGQAGIQFGNVCWDIFCLEHEINPDGTSNKPDSDVKETDKFETFFGWGPKGSLIPRAIYVDLDPETLDRMNVSKSKKIYPHVFKGKEDAASSYARGYYTIEDHVLDSAVCRVRKIAEIADTLEGFVLYHSVGGGTGSGLASHIMERIVPDYGTKTKMAFTLYPGDQTSASVVEPYNALLATHSMMQNIDVSVLFNNDSLFDMCKKKLEIDFPEHKEFNQVIGQVISSITGTMRFDGAMNKLLREFPQNLTPFPKLHFTVGSLSPLESASKPSKTTSVNAMVSNCLDASNQTAPWKPQGGEFISCSFLYRGKPNESGINKAISNIKRAKKVKFSSKIEPADIKVSLLQKCCEVPKNSVLQKQSSSMCMVSNNTALSSIWKNLGQKAKAMLDKKAYIHWYVAEGMEEMEFTEALETLKNLCDEYKNLS